MADNRKLAAGLRNLPASAQEDLYGYSDGFSKSQIANALRSAGEQGIGIAKSVARGVPQMATGFVDLAAMPFEAAGMIEPGKAVGSTKWLEEKGYLPPPQEGFVNQTAEMLASGLDPSTWASHALPLVAGIGKTVWHGSPHKYDKFDLSKIGTGEGAQAYGHGLYLAEARPVAEEYRRNLMGGNDMASQIAASHLNMYKTPEKAVEALQASISPNLTPEAKQMTQNAIDMLNRGEANTGFLYKVDLPDEQIAKMLDWDKPLHEQSPEVIKAMKSMTNDVISGGFDLSRANRDITKAFNPVTRDDVIKEILTEYPNLSLKNGKLYERSGSEIPEMAITDWMRNKHGIGYEDAGQWIRDMSHIVGSQSDVSAALANNGVPGIKYLDAISREGGEGTRNYVVFSDEIPQILERNNQPLVNALRNTEYRGSHTAPGPDFGAQLHDLTGGGQMYPEDVYSPQAVRYYGTGDTKLDKESFAIAQRMRGKPDEMVDIYRAVPNESDITAINAGDWVTINPNYAKQHGESNLPEGYKILSQKVPAKSIWTNADSIHEYGYWPE